VLRRYAANRKLSSSSPYTINAFCFNLRNPSSRTIALGFTQPVSEIVSGGKMRPTHKADSLTAIYGPIV
jgi:hypothetical protein